MKSDTKEIKNYIKKAITYKLDLRKTRISLNFYYLNDYLRHEDYHGTLLGLFNRSKEWHERLERDRQYAVRVRRAQREKEQAELMDKDNKLPAFDITLLDPNVKFLSKVRDLHAESDIMSHCVSGYSERTLDGRSLLKYNLPGRDGSSSQKKQVVWICDVPPDLTSIPLD